MKFSRAKQRQLVAGGAVGAMLLLALLFAPEPEQAALAHLTTHSREATGARGFYETAQRLGWRVSRNERPTLPADHRPVVYASLATGVQPSPHEVHELLERVRAGAGLFLVTRGPSPMTDSLGVRMTPGWAPLREDPDATCATSPRQRAAEALRGPVYAGGFTVRIRDASALRSFLDLERDAAGRGSRMAAGGFTLGRGRVGVISDPDLLANSVFRSCRLPAGVSAVRLLEFVSSDSAGRRIRNSVVFDEYRHGYGEQPSIRRVTQRFITEHPVGRMLGQLSVAGVILLTVAGTRPQPAPPLARRTRRSPLEHARALSLAYSQVSATRTATKLLVRGLRRRLRLTGTDASRSASDEEFLASIAARFPALATDVTRITGALRARVSKSELVATGRSISNIERTIASANQ